MRSMTPADGLTQTAREAGLGPFAQVSGTQYGYRLHLAHEHWITLGPTEHSANARIRSLADERGCVPHATRRMIDAAQESLYFYPDSHDADGLCLLAAMSAPGPDPR